MGKFLTKLQVEKDDARDNHWVLISKLAYQTDDEAVLVAPAGFYTDFASIPRLLWGIIPPWGEEYDKAAVLHDYLYYRQFDSLPRYEADLIFLEAMAAQGVGRFKRNLLYWGVRIGGRGAWDSYTRI